MLGIDWTTLYNWPGYDFWGIVLALSGSGASVFFAFRASKNATRAAEAAESAKRSVSAVDIISECSRVLRLFKEIRMRIDKNEWDRVSELTEDVRVAVSTVNQAAKDNLSETSQEALSNVLSQMSTMARTADKNYHNGTTIDPVRIKSVLAKLSEELSAALAELKQKVEI